MKNSVICTLGGAEAARVLTSKLNIIIIIAEEPTSGRVSQVAPTPKVVGSRSGVNKLTADDGRCDQ